MASSESARLAQATDSTRERRGHWRQCTSGLRPGRSPTPARADVVQNVHAMLEHV
jgi:hypothetical protein